MRTPFLFAALGLVLAGCGGSDHTEVAPGNSADSVDTTELPEDAASISPDRRIDSLHWGEELIEFWDVSGPEDVVPAIMVNSMRSNAHPELAQVLAAQARWAVTPAELWHAATGRDDVPEALWQQHLYQVQDDERPSAEMQQFDLSLVDKATLISIGQFNGAFPLTTANTCWANAQAFAGVDTGPGTGYDHIERYICSRLSTASGVQTGFVDASNSLCRTATSLDVNATVRAVVANRTGLPQLGRSCVGQGGSFGCIDLPFTENLANNTFISGSVAKNGAAHRVAVGLFVSKPPSSVKAASVFFASAQLATGITQFQSNQCGP